jgi:hypothetical protein
LAGAQVRIENQLTSIIPDLPLALQSLCEATPRDQRRQERVFDIPRLVDGAVKPKALLLRHVRNPGRFPSD